MTKKKDNLLFSTVIYKRLFTVTHYWFNYLHWITLTGLIGYLNSVTKNKIIDVIYNISLTFLGMLVIFGIQSLVSRYILVPAKFRILHVTIWTIAVLIVTVLFSLMFNQIVNAVIKISR